METSKPFSNVQTGFITLHKLGVILIVGSILYYGFWLSKYYFDYYTLKGLARDLIREAHIYPHYTIEEKIFKKIESSGAPIYEEDVIIKRDQERIVVRIIYSEYLYFQDYALLELPFEIEEIRYFR